MTYKYWQPSFPLSLKEAIKELFEKYPRLKKLYNGNETEFAREAIREKLKSESIH